MICITYQKRAEKGLTFASLFYLALGDTNPSFTPIGEAQEVYDQVMGKFPV